MSHEIEGNRMFSVREEPWHKLGVVLDNPPTSKEAIVQAGMDWRVLRQPIFFQGPTESFIKIQNKVALIRDIDNKLLSVVSEDYQVLQNHQIFDIFDSWIRSNKATWETAGVLKEGQKVWALAKMANPIAVGGDEVRPYVLLCSGHDGKTSFLVQPANIRVVCNNKLQMSLEQGLIYSIPHRGSVEAMIRIAKEQLEAGKIDFEAIRAHFDALASTKIDTKTFEAYLDTLVTFGNAPEVSDTKPEFVEELSKRQQAMKEKITEIFESGLGMTDEVRNSYWGAYNAAVEFADYHLGIHSKDRVNYLLFGAGAQFKVNALDVALSNT